MSLVEAVARGASVDGASCHAAAAIVAAAIRTVLSGNIDAPVDDLALRSAVVEAGLDAHSLLNSVNGIPSHNLLSGGQTGTV